MSREWISWNGQGEIPSGCVDVMFRDGNVYEESPSQYWCWDWWTGEGAEEIVAYRKHSRKKPKVVRKRPEFTFEDGFFFDFYLDNGGQYNKLDNIDVFCQISGDSVGVLDKDRIRYIIRVVQQALKSSRGLCSQWEHKPLRKKLKLYIKWLQSCESRLQ